jgi:hypothetical protein
MVHGDVAGVEHCFFAREWRFKKYHRSSCPLKKLLYDARAYQSRDFIAKNNSCET